MSDLGVRPVPPQQASATGKPSSDVPLWVLLTAVAVMLALAAAAAFALTYDGSDAKPVRTYPKQWDSRVAPYVKITQKLRGLAFLHPVEVRFLPPAEFKKSVTADEKDLSKEDRAELEQFGAMMRAFGLIKGDVDLFGAINDLNGEGTLAYYSPKDERVTIRGQRVTPAIRSTVVHELTHVLQDQYFKIGDRTKQLEKSSEDDKVTSESSVLDAVIEGDASRVETLYRDSLNARQRKALDAGRKDDVDEAMKSIKRVPKVILTMFTSPYTLGEALLQAVSADGGNAAVDKLFRDTPTNESVLLDPFLFVAGDHETTKVGLPELEDGEKKFDAGEFGVLTWYLMLAERLPLLDALAAADGWGGDAYVAFERDGSTCTRISYVGDTPQDTRRMSSALQRWIAAAPGAPATVSRDGNQVSFESCDPGKTAKVGKDASEDAVALALTRTYLGLGIKKAGASDQLSRCVAGRMVRAFPVASLNDPKFGAGDPAVTQRIQQFAAGCR